MPRSSSSRIRRAFPVALAARARSPRACAALLGRLAERYDPRLIVIAVQHCLHDRAPACPCRARRADRRHRACDQARRPAQRDASDRRARDRGDRAPALCRRSCGTLRRRLYRAAPRLGRTRRDRGSRAGRRASIPARMRAVLAGLFGQPSGERIDVIVNACTHFPLVEAELAAAAPHPVRFVDGGPGIARRVAHLTQGQASAGGTGCRGGRCSRRAAREPTCWRPRWRGTAWSRSSRSGPRAGMQGVATTAMSRSRAE